MLERSKVESLARGASGQVAQPLRVPWYIIKPFHRITRQLILNLPCELSRCQVPLEEILRPSLHHCDSDVRGRGTSAKKGEPRPRFGTGGSATSREHPPRKTLELRFVPPELELLTVCRGHGCTACSQQLRSRSKNLLFDWAPSALLRVATGSPRASFRDTYSRCGTS